MDQFTHMQHDQAWGLFHKAYKIILNEKYDRKMIAPATEIALEAIFVVCRSDNIKKQLKKTVAIGISPGFIHL